MDGVVRGEPLLGVLGVPLASAGIFVSSTRGRVRPCTLDVALLHQANQPSAPKLYPG